MKKSVFVLFVLFTAIACHAQLAHTAWKGAIKGDNPQAAVLKFGKDTLVLKGADGSVLETMTFLLKAGTLTIKKISGQSDCDNVAAGKYTLVFSGNAFSITLLADNCGDRSSALDKTRWVKQ